MQKYLKAVTVQPSTGFIYSILIYIYLITAPVVLRRIYAVSTPTARLRVQCTNHLLTHLVHL